MMFKTRDQNKTKYVAKNFVNNCVAEYVKRM